jgi:hypothetical protein
VCRRCIWYWSSFHLLDKDTVWHIGLSWTAGRIGWTELIYMGSWTTWTIKLPRGIDDQVHVSVSSIFLSRDGDLFRYPILSFASLIPNSHVQYCDYIFVDAYDCKLFCCCCCFELSLLGFRNSWYQRFYSCGAKVEWCGFRISEFLLFMVHRFSSVTISFDVTSYNSAFAYGVPSFLPPTLEIAST